jgi:hypothetical protein
MLINRTRTVVAATALSLALVAGCGTSGDDDNDAGATTTEGSGSSTTEASKGDNGVADLSADEILKKSREALRSAGSVHVEGEVTEDEEGLGINLSISEKGSTGTLKVSGNTVDLVVTSETVYMKGDESFYSSLGTGGPTAAKLLAGKWLSVDADSPQGKSFAQIGDFDAFVDDFLDPGEVAKGEAGTVGGSAAIALEDNDKDDPAQLWVATEGEPYPLQINPKSSDSEKITLSAFGEDVDVTPPPSDEVVSLEDLKNMGDSGN